MSNRQNGSSQSIWSTLALHIVRLMLLVLVVPFAAFAQEATETAAPAEPQQVAVEAADGLMLQADYYAPAGENAPAVLLLHQNQQNRASWAPLVPDLLTAGYAVVAVDLRGHGETGGAVNFQLAIGDVQTWLDWMREQPGVQADAVSIIGGSIGSNLAIVGCANDPACVTVIALSPSLNYFGVTTDEAIERGLANRSALLVSGQRDVESAAGVKELVSLSRGEIGVQFYNDGLHASYMFMAHADTLNPLIVNWLNSHLPESGE